MVVVHRWNREPIRAPGWYDGVPLSVYHSDRITKEPSVSSSGLRTLWSKSAKHFYASWPFNPARDEDDEEESKAFVLGRAAHHLFLGEDHFGLEFILRPERIAGKAWHGNLTEAITFKKQQAQAGRTILSPNDIKIIRGMAGSLSQDRMACDLLQGPVEQTLIAQDPETGIWLRARPDVMPTADGMFADLKTTPSVVDVDLKWTLRSFGYHMQGALIWEICELLGMPFDGFVLVFIEKKSPYCTRVVEITDEDLGRGRLQNRAMIRQVARCLKAMNWPGPGKADAELFSIPKAEQEYIDARLAALEAA
jgi:PDDEXK-like domain of unknown function (DUF3799)